MATLFDEPFDFIYTCIWNSGEQCLYKLSVNLRKWESVNLSTRQWYFIKAVGLKAGFKSFKNHARVQLSARRGRRDFSLRGIENKVNCSSNLHGKRNFTRPDTVNCLLTRNNINLSTLFAWGQFHPNNETHCYVFFFSLINPPLSSNHTRWWRSIYCDFLESKIKLLLLR